MNGESMNTNELIAALQQISPDKQHLPIHIICPNGMKVEPKIKLEFADPNDMFSKDAKVVGLVLTW